MDGRIMRCGIISSCQSAATSEIVKRSWACVHHGAALYQVPDLYLFYLSCWLLKRINIATFGCFLKTFLFSVLVCTMMSSVNWCFTYSYVDIKVPNAMGYLRTYLLTYSVVAAYHSWFQGVVQNRSVFFSFLARAASSLLDKIWATLIAW